MLSSIFRKQKFRNKSKICLCIGGFGGNKCEVQRCAYREEEYIFGSKETIEQINEICPPKIVPTCADCPDYGLL